jgi:hypothetical protein
VREWIRTAPSKEYTAFRGGITNRSQFRREVVPDFVDAATNIGSDLYTAAVQLTPD